MIPISSKPSFLSCGEVDCNHVSVARVGVSSRSLQRSTTYSLLLGVKDHQHGRGIVAGIDETRNLAEERPSRKDSRDRRQVRYTREKERDVRLCRRHDRQISDVDEVMSVWIHSMD